MCQRTGTHVDLCSLHTGQVYAFALHQAQQPRAATNRLDHLFLAAKDFACTEEGHRRLGYDQKRFAKQGHLRISEILSDARELGMQVLHQRRQSQHQNIDSLHREVTRLWAGVAPSSTSILDSYIARAAHELGRSTTSMLALVHERIQREGVINRDHPNALRPIEYSDAGMYGAPLDPEVLSIVVYLEEMTAHARHASRLVGELPDLHEGTGGIWQEFALPLGRSIYYNPVRGELHLPEIDQDSPPRAYCGVHESVAFTLTSARRPGIVVAAAFFPATTGTLENRDSSEYSFAAALANDVFPLNTSHGPAPQRILPDPVRRSLQRGLR